MRILPKDDNPLQTEILAGTPPLIFKITDPLMQQRKLLATKQNDHQNKQQLRHHLRIIRYIYYVLRDMAFSFTIYLLFMK